MTLHHPIIDGYTPEEQMLTYMFDKRINSEVRFEMCVKVFAVMDISRLKGLYDIFWDNKENA
jgi:hypothetical protein